MKIAVIPDGAMIIVNLVGKHNHEVLSATNFSEEKIREKDPYDDDHFDYNAPPFTMTGELTLIGNKYTSNEAPSGVRGRLSMYDYILNNADAAIVLGDMPEGFKGFYDTLNMMILFGCVGCANTQNLLINLLSKRDIPMLRLEFPQTRDDIISMIDKINEFLDCLDNNQKPKTADNLDLNLKKKVKRVSIEEFKEVVNEIKNKENMRLNYENCNFST